MRELAALLTAILSVLGGCGTPAPVAEEPEQAFVYYNGPEPRTVDPGLLTDSYGAFLALNLFEGLTVWDAAANEVRPGVAESWEISEDNSRYTFRLREDARWSDGKPVTADDFVTAWHRVLNPDTQAAFATLLYPIRGARELHTGQTTDASTFGAQVIGPHTLQVDLESPVPYFLALTADAVLLPVKPDCLKKHGWAWTDPGKIIVNGPYTLETWSAGDRVELVRNPRYWDADSVDIGKVVALFTPPEEGLIDAYQAGKLHWTGFAGDTLEETRWSGLADEAGLHAHKALLTGYLVFNTAQAPFDDPSVRRALACALDREAIASPGGRLASDHLVPRGLPRYEPAAGLAHDPERARTLLAEAGYPDGTGIPTVEIAVDDAEANIAAMSEVARQWREVLGLDVKIYVREWRIHVSTVYDGEFQVARYAWSADYPDPSNFMEIFLSSSPLNPAGWQDDAFEDFFKESQRTNDADSYGRLLQSAEKRLLEQAPIVPLYNATSRCLLSPSIQGYHDNLLNVHLLKYLSFGEG